MSDTLKALIDTLDAHQPTYTAWDAYYSGTQPLAYLSPESRQALGSRLGRMASNVPRLAITSLAERLRVQGFDGVDVWEHWLRNDFDQRAGLIHREALTLGRSFVLVWGDKQGRPVLSAESAKQVAITTDPGTGTTTAALKRWSTAKTTEAVLYLPDRIERYTAPVVGATGGGFTLVSTIDNPLDVVPVVPFVNSDRLLDEGVSEIADLAPLVDALNKTVADMLVASEYTARPRRWATGLELEERDVLDDNGDPTGETEAVNPIPEGNRAMVNESPDGKFGQLAGADLSGYTEAVQIITSQIMAVSALPAHYLGVLSNQPASADALRASEAALTARAEARAAQFGRSWEAVADLTTAVASGGPVEPRARARWADPATRSDAQQADAVTKLYASGLLPASVALARLGYSEQEIDQIRAARRAEALDTAGLDLGNA